MCQQPISRTWKKKVFAFCLLGLTGKSISSQVLEPTSSGFQYPEDQLRHQPCSMNNYWIIRLIVGRGIVRLAGPQPVSYFSKSYVYICMYIHMCLYSISPEFLQRTLTNKYTLCHIVSNICSILPFDYLTLFTMSFDIQQCLCQSILPRKMNLEEVIYKKKLIYFLSSRGWEVLRGSRRLGVQGGTQMSPLLSSLGRTN